MTYTSILSAKDYSSMVSGLVKSYVTCSKGKTKGVKRRIFVARKKMPVFTSYKDLIPLKGFFF